MVVFYLVYGCIFVKGFIILSNFNDLLHRAVKLYCKDFRKQSCLCAIMLISGAGWGRCWWRHIQWELKESGGEMVRWHSRLARHRNWQVLFKQKVMSEQVLALVPSFFDLKVVSKQMAVLAWMQHEAVTEIKSLRLKL